MPLGGFEGIELRTGKGFGVIRGKGARVAPRYSLTKIGEIRSEEGEIPGAKGEIASALLSDSAGSMTKRELVNYTKMDDSRVSVLVKRLIQDGYVQEKQGE